MQIIFTLIFLLLALYIEFNKNNLNYLSDNLAYNLFVIAIYLAVMFGTLSLIFMIMFYSDITYGKKKELSIFNNAWILGASPLPIIIDKEPNKNNSSKNSLKPEETNENLESSDQLPEDNSSGDISKNENQTENFNDNDNHTDTGENNATNNNENNDTDYNTDSETGTDYDADTDGESQDENLNQEWPDSFSTPSERGLKISNTPELFQRHLDGYKPTHSPVNEKDLTSLQTYAVSQSALTEILNSQNHNNEREEKGKINWNEPENLRYRFEDLPTTSNVRLESFPGFKSTIKVKLSKLDSESETSSESMLSTSSASASNPLIVNIDKPYVKNMEKYITKKKEADTQLTTDINPNIDID